MSEPAATIAAVLADAAEAEALAAKATPGPWRAVEVAGQSVVWRDAERETWVAVAQGSGWRPDDTANAAYIAAARLGWPRDARRAAAGARLAVCVVEWQAAGEALDDSLSDENVSRQELANDALEAALAAYLAECADVAPVEAE